MIEKIKCAQIDIKVIEWNMENLKTLLDKKFTIMKDKLDLQDNMEGVREKSSCGWHHWNMTNFYKFVSIVKELRGNIQ